jgi:hypothetical protein
VPSYTLAFVSSLLTNSLLCLKLLDPPGAIFVGCREALLFGINICNNTNKMPFVLRFHFTPSSNHRSGTSLARYNTKLTVHREPSFLNPSYKAHAAKDFASRPPILQSSSSFTSLRVIFSPLFRSPVSFPSQPFKSACATRRWYRKIGQNLRVG